MEYDAELKVEIAFLQSEESILTVGWLMSETIRKLTTLALKKNVTRNFASMVALKTAQKLYAIDYWLSNFENSVAALQDRMLLVPFHADERFKVTNQKINIDYFETLVMIGEGGFSKVYLGMQL
mgnify:CR=1 FL=1